MLFLVNYLRLKSHCGVLAVALVALRFDLQGEGGVQAWTYHYNNNPNRDWSSARQWCRQHYTDMVAIQNHQEMSYLNDLLPRNPKYYWIGIRKLGNVWVWVGTNKTLTKECENWAAGEPNNSGMHQDCVEIYIKRELEATKWNDESCSNKKGTLCYKASCNEGSCSTNADCVETIGNYSCWCHLGFQGPKCEEAVTCDILEAPQHGVLQCTDVYRPFQFNSICAFHCTQGFTLVGAESLRCLASARWTSDPPFCQAVKCPDVPDAPKGSRKHCTHPIEQDSYKSTCEYVCEEGFELHGSSRIQCDSEGMWTGDAPVCEAVLCGAIAPPFMGNMTCDDPHKAFSFQSSCQFSCKEGYTLMGAGILTCPSSGTWTAGTPTCEVVKCNVPPASDHGSLRCHHPVQEFSYGSTCWQSCDEGFLLIGTNVTVCTSQGTWRHNLAICQAQKCDTLKAPPNSSLSCSHPHGEFSFNSSCIVSCEEGFLLNGTGLTRCTSMGTWSDTTPVCQVVKCGILSPPLHGSMHCQHPVDEFSYSSTCRQECEEGFLLKGPESTYCTQLGNWSHVSPLCEAQSCNMLLDPPHGSLSCSHPHGEFSFNSSCIVSCEEGFLLNGTGLTRCTSMRTWSDTMPVCQVVKCGILSPPLHGSMHCQHPVDEFSYSSTCRQECEEGFLLKGPESTYCTQLGNWSHVSPLCEAQRCNMLLDPPHGSLSCSHPHGEFSFNSSCIVSCEDGYLINGSGSTTCTSMGTWSDTHGTCQAVQCKALEVSLPTLSMNCSHPLGNFSYQSQCNFHCEDGYAMNGTEELSCTSHGFWTNPMPSCLVVEMSIVMGMLMYAGMGSVVFILLGGLAFLIATCLLKRANKKHNGNRMNF